MSSEKAKGEDEDPRLRPQPKWWQSGALKALIGLAIFFAWDLARNAQLPEARREPVNVPKMMDAVATFLSGNLLAWILVCVAVISAVASVAKEYVAKKAAEPPKVKVRVQGDKAAQDAHSVDDRPAAVEQSGAVATLEEDGG